MKIIPYFAFIFFLFLGGCASHLQSSCSEYFQSCERQEAALNCEQLTHQNLDWVPDISKLQGPLDLSEIESFKTSDQVSKDFISESEGADSYWWYVDGHKERGTQGIIAIKGCTILTQQSLEVWILDDIAMLYNERFKRTRLEFKTLTKTRLAG
jgi:hypothetical protein